VTAFELGATSPDKHLADPARAAADLLAAGVATDLPRAKAFEEARVFFGIAVAGEWTTPGRSIGGQTLAGYSGSTVTVAVDTNLDGAEDVTIEVESGRRQGPPYSDVMTARVNVTKTGEQRDALYVDMLPSDRLEALPLHNSVIVLPALLSSLGVAAESPAFAWSVRTHAPDGQTVDRIGWLRYDPSRPALDTARGFEGLPAFTGLAPVRVVADPTASADGELPHLLLLHHMNVAGKRTETVSLAGAKAGGDDDVALSLLAPKTLEAGAATTLEILVDNRGRFAAEGVRIDGAVEGATVRSTQPTRGTCGEANALPCSLGAIAPGGQARVRLTVVPTGGSPVRLRAQLTTEHACDAVADDDVLETAMPVVGSASPASLPDAAGGCGCRTAGAGAGGAKGAAALGLGALALVLSRRRRSR
jgi:MYXO-CTERM domain-containing protein